MFNKLFQNTCKPKGTCGKFVLRMMNSGHAKLSDWAFTNINLNTNDHVLDIGCGGGANIAKMLRTCTKGFVAGIDYSEESVKYSQKMNRDNIGKNCEIKVGNVNNIEYKDESFNLVTAFETIYFWTDLKKDFKEVKRVLKSHGCFLICCEEGDPLNDSWSEKIPGMKVYGIEQIVAVLKDVGFEIERANRKPDSKWICIVARNK